MLMNDWGGEPTEKRDPWLRLEATVLSVCVLVSYAACFHYIVS